MSDNPILFLIVFGILFLISLAFDEPNGDDSCDPHP